MQKKNALTRLRRKVSRKVCLIEVKGCDIERVGIVAVEKRRKTRGNFSEVNVIFQLAGY